MKSTFLTAVEAKLSNGVLSSKNMNLRFTDSPSESDNMSGDVVSVLTSPSAARTSFDVDEYRRFLTAKRIGQLVIYSDVVSSTMSFIDG